MHTEVSLDRIPREQLRGEIHRLEGEVLAIGDRNAAMAEAIQNAIERLEAVVTREEFVARDIRAAIRILRRSLRSSLYRRKRKA